MKVGDLVKRRPEWGDWVKHNPWMYTNRDFETGIVVRLCNDLGLGVVTFDILLNTGVMIYEQHPDDFTVVNEARRSC